MYFVRRGLKRGKIYHIYNPSVENSLCKLEYKGRYKTSLIPPDGTRLCLNCEKIQYALDHPDVEIEEGTLVSPPVEYYCGSAPPWDID